MSLSSFRIKDVKTTSESNFYFSKKLLINNKKLTKLLKIKNESFKYKIQIMMFTFDFYKIKDYVFLLNNNENLLTFDISIFKKLVFDKIKNSQIFSSQTIKNEKKEINEFQKQIYNLINMQINLIFSKIKTLKTLLAELKSQLIIKIKKINSKKREISKIIQKNKKVFDNSEFQPFLNIIKQLQDKKTELFNQIFKNNPKIIIFIKNKYEFLINILKNIEEFKKFLKKLFKEYKNIFQYFFIKNIYPINSAEG
ncbi:hypothetical protein [Candidatus Phytoplasma mali]|uniref:hypothetical protein n=1 Tax=Apple proliferation phytoplasma TaxID=37692 RepID=UPI0002ECE88D|nr:hypothetical protein [Candidatus Phytoplasma mali]